MNCKYCDAPLPVGSSPRRLFCDDAHKMRWHRQQQQEDQHAALLTELAELRAKVQGLEQEKADTRELVGTLEQENNLLKKQLDAKRRSLSDTGVHGFKTWLKTQPYSLVAATLLAAPLVPPRGSRGTYQGYVKKLIPDEMDDFLRLWELMFTQS